MLGLSGIWVHIDCSKDIDQNVSSIIHKTNFFGYQDAIFYPNNFIEIE